MAGYSVAHLDEIDVIDDGREPFRAVRHHLGITAFGVTAWTARNAGDRIINEHDESDDGSEELYVVTQGRATFELDGERVDAPVGSFVFVRPSVKRTAYAEEPGTTIVAVGGVEGKPYEAGGWEIWAPLNPLYREGRYDEAVERGRELIESNPQYATPLYNLACCEALAGHTSDAIDHLREAFARSDRLRDFAKEDSDLDSLRAEPAFKELVGDQ